MSEYLCLVAILKREERCLIIPTMSACLCEREEGGREERGRRERREGEKREGEKREEEKREEGGERERRETERERGTSVRKKGGEGRERMKRWKCVLLGCVSEGRSMEEDVAEISNIQFLDEL